MNVRNWSKKSSGLTAWRGLYGVDKLRTFIVRSWCNRVEWLHGVGLCLQYCTVLYCIKWLWPVKVTLKIIKWRLKVFCWSCDGVPLKWNKKNCRASSLLLRIKWAYRLAPQFEWSVNTFKETKIFNNKFLFCIPSSAFPSEIWWTVHPVHLLY